jgi:hypothetical protein
MRARATKWAALVVLLSFAACGKESDGDDATVVAINNGGTAAVDAVISDGDTELTFSDVAPGTTSGFQTATFGSLSALTVTVGSTTSNADLNAGARNVVNLAADGRVDRVVTQAAPSSGGGDDGW